MSSSVRRAIRLPRMPRAAWVCALIAFLNAACWSFITPPLQGPDEDSHLAYVQYLAETGKLPTSSSTEFSPEEIILYRDLNTLEVNRNTAIGTALSRSQQRRLRYDLAQPYSRTGNAAANEAAAEPPLYYALEAVPYLVGSGANILVRIELMRLLSALLTAVAVAFVYLFLREVLPGHRWSWAIGTLGVAFAPLLGFIGGSINPDVMLTTVTSALFYLLARAFRRGLSTRMAAGIGTLTALGLLTKLNFLGLLPGLTLGIVLLGLRIRPSSKRRAYGSGVLAALIASSPIALPFLIGTGSTHGGPDGVSRGISILGSNGSIFDELSYIWQVYLPRLPGMSSYFPGVSTSFQVWFRGMVGKYNWLETQFPTWAYALALFPAGLIAVLCGRQLHTNRTALRRQAGELCVYLVMVVGVMAMVGASSYGGFPNYYGLFMEPRYFMPFLALAAVALALAARGAGRWAPTASVLLVVASIAHDIFSQLLVVSRFYG